MLESSVSVYSSLPHENIAKAPGGRRRRTRLADLRYCKRDSRLKSWTLNSLPSLFVDWWSYQWSLQIPSFKVDETRSHPPTGLPISIPEAAVPIIHKVLCRSALWWSETLDSASLQTQRAQIRTGKRIDYQDKRAISAHNESFFLERNKET